MCVAQTTARPTTTINTKRSEPFSLFRILLEQRSDHVLRDAPFVEIMINALKPPYITMIRVIRGSLSMYSIEVLNINLRRPLWLYLAMREGHLCHDEKF